jgi:hypothetical protein
VHKIGKKVKSTRRVRFFFLRIYWVACTNLPNTPTLPLTCRLPRPHMWILEWAVIILINAHARSRTWDLWLWYHIGLHAPTNSTQKLKLMRKGGQFTYTPTVAQSMDVDAHIHVQIDCSHFP